MIYATFVLKNVRNIKMLYPSVEVFFIKSKLILFSHSFLIWSITPFYKSENLIIVRCHLNVDNFDVWCVTLIARESKVERGRGVPPRHPRQCLGCRQILIHLPAVGIHAEVVPVEAVSDDIKIRVSFLKSLR